jgi:hypothetical protein
MVEQPTTIKIQVIFLYKIKIILDSNGQSNPANGVYPSNYGLYLSNSSLFSKLGNDIISSNGKMNPNQAKNKMNVNSILQNQPIKNLKNQNNNGGQINGINPNGILIFLLIHSKTYKNYAAILILFIFFKV